MSSEFDCICFNEISAAVVLASLEENTWSSVAVIWGGIVTENSNNSDLGLGLNVPSLVDETGSSSVPLTLQSNRKYFISCRCCENQTLT